MLYRQELVDEGDQDLLLSRSNIDRAIMARLMMEPSASLQRPFFYLLDVYARCSRELRTTDSYKDKALAQQLHAIVLQAQELALSHTNLVLTMDLFPKASLPEQDFRPRATCVGLVCIVKTADRSVFGRPCDMMAFHLTSKA